MAGSLPANMTHTWHMTHARSSDRFKFHSEVWLEASFQDICLTLFSVYRGQLCRIIDNGASAEWFRDNFLRFTINISAASYKNKNSFIEIHCKLSNRQPIEKIGVCRCIFVLMKKDNIYIAFILFSFVTVPIRTKSHPQGMLKLLNYQIMFRVRLAGVW